MAPINLSNNLFGIVFLRNINIFRIFIIDAGLVKVGILQHFEIHFCIIKLDTPFFI